ncbi:hypothetical protein CEV31_3136 [Brucella thiophenivorans]|uniref:Uncharacterized protein n=1 Tax=Brucella thiophenivorans TaxID=571255 RepID=A0A256FIW1_9HYPH|nr:hypothetical protein CEV31_3136 [Brucella thiophenivorans]
MVKMAGFIGFEAHFYPKRHGVTHLNTSCDNHGGNADGRSLC